MTLAQKLQIKTGERIRVLHAPEGVALDLPVDATAPGVLLFVSSVAELNKRAPEVLKSLGHDALLWIAYPKKSGAIKTDINRDSGWDIVAAAGVETVRAVSIDDTWSALRFRPISR